MLAHGVTFHFTTTENKLPPSKAQKSIFYLTTNVLMHQFFISL